MKYKTPEDALREAPNYTTHQEKIAWARGYNAAAAEANEAIREAEHQKKAVQRLRDEIQTLKWDRMELQHRLGELQMGPDW
jgi:chromosome segregation ATPase